MEENEKYTQESMTALEAILFAAAAPVPYGRLSETLGLKSEVIQEMCRTLSNDYERRGAGIRMQFMNAQVQLTTAPEVSSAVETFLGLEATQKLSRAALETLTIIAYRQPVTKGEIEAIRGIRCDRVMEGLVRKGLVRDVGRSEAVGRPILYGTTDEFLKQFGFETIKELPEIKDIEGLLDDETDMPEGLQDSVSMQQISLDDLSSEQPEQMGETDAV